MNILEELEMLIKLNEDDFDRGKGKYILQQFIDEQKSKLNKHDVSNSVCVCGYKPSIDECKDCPIILTQSFDKIRKRTDC